jgi:hypothetical protein
MPGFKDFLEDNKIEHNILPIDEDDGVMMIIKQDFEIDYIVEKMN